MKNFNGGKKGGWKDKKRDFGFRDSDGPEMFEATCSECGDLCEVPFKPNGRKPVFCRDCFKNNNSEDSFSFDRKPFKSAPVQNNDNKEQFEMLNAKLDYILKALALLGATKLSSEESARIEEAAPKTKKRVKKAS